MGPSNTDSDVIGTVPAEVLRFRGEFPILEHKVYLANNSKGPVSHAVLQAHAEYLDGWRTQGTPWESWAKKHEQLRAAFARMIGAQMHEIALLPSTTTGLGTLAAGIDWRSDRPAVAFDDYNFPSVTYLWHAQAAYGAEIRRVHPDEHGELPPEAFDQVLDERCKLLSVAHVCYKNGHRVDLPAIGRRAHDVGAWVFVDDYQSCGSRAVNVREAGIDVLSTGTYKFMLGSAGVAFLYVAEELLDQLHPRLTGWYGQEDRTDFQINRHVEASGATRFQIGTPAYPSIYDSLAGIELLSAVGFDQIRDWIEVLTARLTARLEDEGFVLASPRDPGKRGPQVAIRAHDMDRAVADLMERDIIASCRGGNLRIAFHYFNTFGDIDVLMDGLHACGTLERA